MTARFALAFVVSLGCQPVSDGRPPAPLDYSKLISFMGLGGQADPAHMHSHLSTYNISWADFVQQRIVPELDWGVRRIMLHLPFGKDETTGSHSFDSYIVAQQRGLTIIVSGFEEEIRKVIAGEYTAGEPVEVICYLGALGLDPDFIQLMDEQHGGDDWILRFWWSVKPVLDAGCSVAFDAAATWPPDGPEHHIAKTIRALGTKVYIEGTETHRLPDDVDWRTWEPQFEGHLRSLPIVASHLNFHNNIARETPHPTVRYDDWRLYPGVMLLVNGHAAPLKPDGSEQTPAEVFASYLEWAPDMAREDWALGFDVAMELRPVIPVMTIEQLIGDG